MRESPVGGSPIQKITQLWALENFHVKLLGREEPRAAPGSSALLMHGSGGRSVKLEQ